MQPETDGPGAEPGDLPPRPPLSDAAKRALAEAEERRRAREAARPAQTPIEIGGREGPDPVRFGDWEKDGLVSDF